MSLRWDRVLDRAWLALSGAGLIALTLQLGAQLGARRWSCGAGATVLAAHAAVPEAPVRADLPTGCRDGPEPAGDRPAAHPGPAR
ncbi:hypothetical protein [Methylobacterium sp. NEAU K]|uniref:hypothetical protein n=1 Tax=Methylobacterium sp. NEAU K TaxID=3064946 RepID=UPI0027357440|nr:hypothetical protein [Methylobacterium sp. NEAU K]MDP4004170.1 hypothetical protein [Methylobacterium sp. NEAU K]